MFIFLYAGKPSPCKRDSKLTLPYRGIRTYNSTQRRRPPFPAQLLTKEAVIK